MEQGLVEILEGDPLDVRAETMVTPVANMPRAERNCGAEKLGGLALGWFIGIA